MNTPKAILSGAIIIAATIVFMQALNPAKASGQDGLFMLMRHSNTTATSSVFRLNTATGGVSFCFVNAAGTSISCTREVM